MKRNPPKNPFDDATRSLFMFNYKCFNCGRSDLGLELDHVIGRGSKSPYNACPLCIPCHKVKTRGNRTIQLQWVKDFLDSEGYQQNKKDIEFLTKYKKHYEK